METATPQPSAAPAPAIRPGRRELAWRLGLVAVLNLPLTLFICRTYLYKVPEGTTGIGWTATLIAWLSNSAMLVLAAWIVLLPWLMLIPRRWALVLLALVGGSLLQIALTGDAVVYGLWKCHYNHMVWLALTSPGAGDSIELGWSTVLEIVLTVGFIIAAQVGISWLALRPLERWRGWRPVTAVMIAWAVITLVDKAFFLWGDINRRPDITRLERLLPLYQPIYMKRFAIRMGWMDPQARIHVDPGAASDVQYPIHPVATPASARRMNIVMVAIEGCRPDMVDPAVMPHLHALAERSTWCRNHWSSGNATRFGLFGLFYGIHATYWPAMLAERREPLLFRILRDLDYRMRVDSCTDLNFPEFRQTTFVGIPEALHDTWDDKQLPRTERDRVATDRAVAFISQADDHPFFSFVFYDASHSPYRYPDEHALYQPTEDPSDVNYLKISRDSSVEALAHLANRYRNSLHYVDSQIGRLVAAVEAAGAWDDTAIVIVGDHGQEFGELGFYGHNGTFDRCQAQAACVVHIPGVADGAIDRLTSHIDIASTLLTALGVDAPLGDYTNGQPLQDPTERDYLMVCSWDSVGIVDGHSTMVIGLESYNQMVEVLGDDYRPMPDQQEAVDARRSRVVTLMREMHAFLR